MKVTSTTFVELSLSRFLSEVIYQTLPEAQRTQGIDSLTLSINHITPLALVPNCNAICIGSNFGHQMTLLAWPPDGATISCKIGYQMAPLA